MTQVDIKSVVEDELKSLLGSIKGEINSPENQEAMTRMSRNMAMLPIWIAQNEDVTDLVKDMQAESLVRGVAFTLKSQSMAQQAWLNVLTKVITTAISMTI